MWVVVDPDSRSPLRAAASIAVGSSPSAARIVRLLPGPPRLYWPIDPSISRMPWFNFQIDFARCLWVVLPASLLWGATFPLALASVSPPSCADRG